MKSNVTGTGGESPPTSTFYYILKNLKLKKRCVECQQDVGKQYFRMSVRQYVSKSIYQNTTFQHGYQNESCSECYQEKIVK